MSTPSSAPTRALLTPRIVAPPKLSEDGVPCGRNRRLVPPHPPRIVDDGNSARRPTTARITAVGTVPQATQERVKEHQAYLTEKARARQAQHQHQHQHREDLACDLERVLDVECSVGNAGRWGEQVGARFLERCRAALQLADAEDNLMRRADAIVNLLEMIATVMKTYNSVFTAIAVVVRQLVTSVHASQEEVAAQREAIVAAEGAHQRALLGVERQWRERVAALEASIDADKAGRERLHEELYRVRQERTEIAKEKQRLARADAESLSVRRQSEAMAAQFALRNRELEDRLPVLEAQVSHLQRVADQQQQLSSRYARRVQQLEGDLSATEQESKATIDGLQRALEASRTRCAELEAGCTSLKSTKSRLEQRVAVLEESLAAHQASHETELRSLTPRPQFRDQECALFGGLTSTANRVDAIAQQLDARSQQLEDALHTNVTLAVALRISKRVATHMGALPARCPFTELSAVSPLAAPEGLLLPPMFASQERKVKCRAMHLRETVMKLRELLDVHVSMAARTNKTVVMHMVILSHFSDSHRAAIAAVGGLKPNAPLSIRGNDRGCIFDFVAPMAVTEQCYALVHATEFWRRHPIVFLFGAVMREELGVWVWVAQNSFVSRMLVALSSFGNCDATFILEKLEGLLRAEGFSRSFIEAACHGFCEIYGVESSVFSSSSPANAALGHLGSALGDQRKGRGGLEVSISIDFDPGKNGPALATAVNELPLTSLLRMLFVERQLQFNAELDRLLSLRATSSPSGRRVITTSAAIAATQRAAAVSSGAATEFVTAVAASCAAQARLELALVRSPPEMQEGASAAQNLFVSGLTASYFGAAPYPHLEPYSQASAAPAAAAASAGAGVAATTSGRVSGKLLSIAANAPGSRSSRTATPATAPLLWEQTGTASPAVAILNAIGVSEHSASLGAAGTGGSGQASAATTPHTTSLMPRRGTGNGTSGVGPAGSTASDTQRTATFLHLFCRMFRKVALIPAHFEADAPLSATTAPAPLQLDEGSSEECHAPSRMPVISIE